MMENQRIEVVGQAKQAQTLAKRIQNVCKNTNPDSLGDWETPPEKIQAFVRAIRSDVEDLTDALDVLQQLADFHTSARNAEELVTQAFAKRSQTEE